MEGIVSTLVLLSPADALRLFAMSSILKSSKNDWRQYRTVIALTTMVRGNLTINRGLSLLKIE